MKEELNRRRAKIVCTLGPGTNTEDRIFELARAGMDVARLNFSHGTHQEHQQRIEIVRHVSAKIGRPIAIMQDLQGPKIRIQTFENGPVFLESGASFTLTTRQIRGNQKIVSVSYPGLVNDVKPGDLVLLDDGLIKLIVEEVEGQNVHTRVEFGGVLKDKKGLNLPGSILSVDILSDKDLADLIFGLEMQVDYVALSFVQKPDDVTTIKKFIAEYDHNTPVIAKIEKPQAVDTLDAITDVADAIMVARGDLGVECPVEEVPLIQKKLISMCNEKGIPVITATQMLESMIKNPRPTRAEASDVANAILDGTDAVMLSGETAVGDFPVEAVETMARIIAMTEARRDIRWDLRRRKRGQVYSIPYAIGYSACHSVDLVDGSAIISMTQSGQTARMIARFRPGKPIVAITHDRKTYHQLSLVWGVRALMVDAFESNINEAIAQVIHLLKSNGIVTPGETLVITAGLPFEDRSTTNMIRLEIVSD